MAEKINRNLKPAESRDLAQQKLINTAIKLGVAALYERAEQRQWTPNTDIHIPNPQNTSQKVAIKLGETQEEVVSQFCAIPNEFERVRAFSLLAKQNGLNLSIKSAGSKSAQSIRRKQNILGLEKSPITDEVRVSFVSSDLALLDQLTTQMADSIKPSQPDHNLPTQIEKWYMRSSGMLHQVVKTSIDGFGAEIQFLPREQARMGTRITHHFLKVLRVYDDVTRSFESIDNIPAHLSSLAERATNGDAISGKRLTKLSRKLEQSNDFLAEYNKLAGFLNRLASQDALGHEDMDNFNQLLHNLDESSQTYDEVSEGGEPNGTYKGSARSKKHFSPIFKTSDDFISYRQFMREQGNAIGLFPLPIITAKTPQADVENAIMKIATCSQLTHACYMNGAEEPFRRMWVEKAKQINQRLGDSPKKIPEGAIAWVQGDLVINVPDKVVARA